MNGKVEYNYEPWHEEQTQMAVEAVKTFDDDDTCFITDLRVLSGPDKGQLKTNRWFRRKRNGEPRKDTSNLLKLFGLDVDAPAHKMQDKIFSAKPWYPEGQKFPVFTKIEAVEDPF